MTLWRLILQSLGCSSRCLESWAMAIHKRTSYFRVLEFTNFIAKYHFQKKKKNFGILKETDVNEVSVRSSSNPMPTGQRYGGKDLLLPFESRHYSHQSLVISNQEWLIFRGDY